MNIMNSLLLIISKKGPVECKRHSSHRPECQLRWLASVTAKSSYCCMKLLFFIHAFCNSQYLWCKRFKRSAFRSDCAIICQHFVKGHLMSSYMICWSVDKQVIKSLFHFLALELTKMLCILYFCINHGYNHHKLT